ncbi:MAG: HAD family hydrolase [Nitriliruptor sp.]
MSSRPATLLDLDGTLVDSVYHHVVAWQDALREVGHEIPTVRIHAGIGMGGDRLLPWLLGGHGAEGMEQAADGHRRRFLERADDLTVTPGARELLEDLRERDVPFVVATSAGEAEREVLLGVLGEPDLPLAGAGEHDSKPSPETLIAACGQMGVTPEQAVLVGDSPWDAIAARLAGVRSIGVRCGGFSDRALREGGVARVVDHPRELIGQL